MNYIYRAVRLLKKEGFISLVKKATPFVYDRHIAPHLPRTGYASYNGVSVKAARCFDSTLPWRNPDHPHYESGLISGLNEQVYRDDSVVIIGGGWGVTTVKAGQKVGESGDITVYEGAASEINKITDTITKNNVSDRTDIVHAIVGQEISLRGEAEDAERISPRELPECDVLLLDCEGSEVEILEKLSVRPRVILVESHGMYDAPSDKIEELLEGLAYSIKLKEPAVKDSEFCINNDIYSITAVRK